MSVVVPARQPGGKGVHAAIHAFEASAEFALCEQSGGRNGVVDIDALLAAAGADVELPAPGGLAARPQLHGVG